MNRDPFFNPPTNIDFTHEDPQFGLAIGVSRGGMPPGADPMDAPRAVTTNIDPYHDQLGRFTTGPGLGGRGGYYPQLTEIPSGAPASAQSATTANTPPGGSASTPSSTPASAPSGTLASMWSGTPEKSPSGKGKSSLEIVLSSFPIDTTYEDRAQTSDKATAKGHKGQAKGHKGQAKGLTGKAHQKGQANPGGVYLTHYGPSTWDPTPDSNSDKGIGNHNNKLNGLSLAISDDLARPAGLVLGRPVYLNGRFIGNYDDRAPEDGRVDIYDHDNRAGTRWGGMVWGGRLSSHP